MKYWEKPFGKAKPITTKGKVQILDDRCKGCNFCVEYCPQDILVISKKFNKKGYHPPEIINHELCCNCGLCEVICPDFAIFVTDRNDLERKEILDEKK